MKYVLVVAGLLLSCSALANPGVTKDSDVGKRKSKKHYQVTRCEDGKCSVYEVTEFDKKFDTKGNYHTQCLFVEEGNKRFMACNKDTPVKTETQIVEKVVEKTVYVDKNIDPRKHRVAFHLGYGPMGLESAANEDEVKVKQSYSLLPGLNYSYLLGERVSVGVGAYLNTTFNLSIGFDF